MKLHSVPAMKHLDAAIHEASITQAEAARELGMKLSTLRSMVRRGSIEAGPLTRVSWVEIERVRAIRAGGAAARNPLDLSGPVAA